jgi:DNA-binding response OmpR family regulator
VQKPFSAATLVGRITDLIRRRGPSGSQRILPA